MVRARRRCRGRRTVYPGVSEGGTFSRNTRGGVPCSPAAGGAGCGAWWWVRGAAPPLLP